MSKITDFMHKQMTELNAALSSFNVPVFEDELAEDEEEAFAADAYHCFVYETGAMTKKEDLKSVNQVVTIYYYSENRDDLDERAIEIIQALSSVTAMSFKRSDKQRLQKKDTDRFIDRIIFVYDRRVVVGCQI